MMKDKRYADVVVVGGGASGLAAAVELRMSSPELAVAVVEKNPELGRKLRATGSGRCNITNTAAFGYNEILKFFARIGLVTRTCENGLVYPYSESAADVADLLTARAEELGVQIITAAEVQKVICSDTAESAAGSRSKAEDCPRFAVEYTQRSADREKKSGGGVPGGYAGKMLTKTLTADFVILACGGKAGPMFGTTGDGFRLARELGHSIVTPIPVLTSIECEEWADQHRPAGITLAGTRTRGRVTLYKCDTGGTGLGVSGPGTELFEETGEIQFTRYGLSGICVFNMTRHMRYDREAGESLRNFIVKADLFPDGDIETFLRERRRAAFHGEKTAEVLRTVLKANIADYVLETAGIAAEQKHFLDKNVEDLTDADIECIGTAVHELAFHPDKVRGWKDAQATSGGVSLREIDPDTCESLLIPGFYITGELADRDFHCGGFNLSNAWLTGLCAAGDITGKSDKA